MRKPYIRIFVCVIGLAALSGCAHPSASSTAVAPSPDQKNDIVVPPQMTGGTSMMKLRSTGSRPHGTVEIPVDAMGRPDIYGIRYVGTFSDVTRRDIADFVSTATFIPGKRNGIPASAVYKMTFK